MGYGLVLTETHYSIFQSGLVAGKTFGVAKGSKIIGIKVLSDAGSGSNADIIRGIDFAVDEATRKQKRGIVK